MRIEDASLQRRAELCYVSPDLMLGTRASTRWVIALALLAAVAPGAQSDSPTVPHDAAARDTGIHD
jgi:hypothetical protein